MKSCVISGGSTGRDDDVDVEDRGVAWARYWRGTREGVEELAARLVGDVAPPGARIRAGLGGTSGRGFLIDETDRQV